MKNLVYRIKCPPMSTNCYILSDRINAVIIDPAGNADTAHIISDLIDSLKLSVSAVMLTHGHFDHTSSVDNLFKKYRMPIFIHEDDFLLSRTTSLNCAELFNAGDIKITSPCKTFSDGSMFVFGDVSIRAIHTPGHTAGSSCFVTDEYIFTGDTLFEEGVGRTDLPTSNGADFERSLEKVKKMITGQRIYPGH